MGLIEVIVPIVIILLCTIKSSSSILKIDKVIEIEPIKTGPIVIAVGVAKKK